MSKPIFVLQKTFSGNFVAIYEIKPVLTLNKPINGLVFWTAIEFHCNYIGVKCGCDAKFLLQTQTVQFMRLKKIMFMKIFMKTGDCLILAIILKICDFMIWSCNEKVIGKMKHEVRVKIIMSLLDFN